MLNKQIIKDAIADAKEIERFAIEQAKKSLEETLMPQIEKAIQESLNESSESAGGHAGTISESPVPVAETLSENTTPKNIQEMGMHNEENMHEEELFEVEGLFEDEVPAENPGGEEVAQEPAEDSVEAKLDDLAAKIDQLLAATQGGEEDTSAEGEVEVVDDEEAGAEAPAAPAPAAPAPAAPAAPAPAEPAQTVTEDMEEEGLDEVMFEIEEEGLYEDMEEESLFEDLEEEGFAYEVSLEEDMEEEGLDEDLYEISLSPDPEEDYSRPAPPKGGRSGGMFEDMEEEGLYEIDMEEEGLYEIDMEEEGMNEELEEEGMFEIDMEEEGVEENTMQNNVNIHRAKERGKRKPNYVSPASLSAINESKIKAQYESKMGELIKENESLKGVIKNYKSNLKEFESSFVELKSQLNEMQVFNGKLAYANKLLTKGGLTNDEKIRIAEEFDKCPTVEDAKRLYNKIISENNFSTKETIADKLKSAKPSTASSKNLNESKSETLFESEERRRMRMLAGIVKPINE